MNLIGSLDRSQNALMTLVWIVNPGATLVENDSNLRFEPKTENRVSHAKYNDIMHAVIGFGLFLFVSETPGKYSGLDKKKKKQ